MAHPNADLIITLAEGYYGSSLPAETTHRVATQSDAEAVSGGDTAAADSAQEVADFENKAVLDPFYLRVLDGGTPDSASREIMLYLNWATKDFFVGGLHDLLLTGIADIISESIPSPAVNPAKLLFVGDCDLTTDFPTTTGSGAGGQVKKGDLFYVATGGTPTAVLIATGKKIMARIDSPGQVDANWIIFA